jgi:D-aminopeptidase
MPAFCGALLCAAPPAGRQRPRSLGLAIGELPAGPGNAITDVPGVAVGQVTIVRGEGVRTGVTAILPHAGNLFLQKVPAAIHVWNGFGKLAGYTQVRELGNIETPIVLTNTLAVGVAVEALVRYTLAQPGNGEARSVNAVVGETNDGWLNDIRGLHVRREDVLAAIAAARAGPVAEGAVGAGTGTRALGWKGGIGTASRLTAGEGGRGYTVGVLVQSNFGSEFVMLGVPVTRELTRSRAAADPGGLSPPGGSSTQRGSPPEGGSSTQRGSPPAGGSSTQRESPPDGGSCMIVVATDAPLSERNLERLARRAFAGMARTTAFMANGSGDYAIAFSTAYTIPHHAEAAVAVPALLANEAMNSLFRAVEEATEEAICNSLFMAETVVGIDGHRAEGLPIGAVLALMKKNNR